MSNIKTGEKIAFSLETEFMLSKAYFCEGMANSDANSKIENHTISDEQLNKLYETMYNMRSYLECFDTDVTTIRFLTWYKYWDQEPIEMKKIGKVVGDLISKDITVIDDIYNCTDYYFLCRALGFTNPEKFKYYLETTKPRWRNNHEVEKIFAKV